MECSKLNKALNIIKHFSFKGYLYSKNEIQSLIDTLEKIVQGLECFLAEKSDKLLYLHLKLCLLQLRRTIKQILDLLNDSSYLKKTDILTLLLKKIHLCLKEILSISEKKSLPSSNLNYHKLMCEIISSLKSTQIPSDLKSLIDDLLCTSLTIAKIAIDEDSKEITSSCKNVLTAVSSLQDLTCDNKSEFNSSYLLYQINYLERKVNSAMLRLFLQIMSYPQENLKKVIKACGNTFKSERYSEDIEEEISHFDLTCDRIGLIGNFAIMSCEQDALKLKVKNCLANLEFCEESLVPASIDFYLDPSNDKRELLKYLCKEWKSEVHLINSYLNSIVDPAAFSLVVFEDLSELVQIEKNNKPNDHSVITMFYQRCSKFIQFMCESPDCISDQFVTSLRKSLDSELKSLEREAFAEPDSSEALVKMEVILPLIDQICEYLNRTLINCTALSDVSGLSINESTLKDSMNISSKSFRSHICLFNSTTEKELEEWKGEYKDKTEMESNKQSLDGYLQIVHYNSPFVFTLYQKTPVKDMKNMRRRIAALSLDVSKCLGESFEA